MKTKLSVFLTGKTLKKCAVLFWCALLAHTSLGQPPIQWQRSFGGTLNETLSSIVFTADSGYGVSGTATSTNVQVVGNHGASDFWFVKTDSFGLIKWQSCYGGSAIEVCNGGIKTRDKGFLLFGSTSSSLNGQVGLKHAGGLDFWIIKIDSLGVLQWQKCYGGTSASGDVAFSAVQMFDGGYVITGATCGNTGASATDITVATGGTYKGGPSDMWVIRVDSNGVLKWQKCIGLTGTDYGNCVSQTSDSCIAVFGSSNSVGSGSVSGNHGGYDAWFLKLDTMGNVLWHSSLGGSADEFGGRFVQNSDHGYTLVSTTFSNGSGQVTSNFGGSDIWVTCLDSVGTLKWQKNYGGVSNEAGYSIAPTQDGGYLITGNTASNNTGMVFGYHALGDIWVFKIDSVGNLQWQKCLGGSQIEFGTDCLQTPDGYYTIGGFSGSSDGDVTGNHGPTPSLDFWIVRLSNNPILPLPIKLASFEAFLLEEKIVKLNWATFSENNNNYFIVEKSSDLEKWFEAGYLQSSCGTCTEKQNYSLEDKHPFTGVSYYRIKQVDFNGKFSYSGSEAVYINRRFVEVGISTQITNGPMFIYGLTSGQNIEIYDMQSRIIEKYKVNNDSLNLNLSLYAKGMYIIHIIDEKKVTSFKITKF
jgi:hypothetical protein